MADLLDLEENAVHIQIVGGGAIGLFVASLACAAGFPVTLVTRTVQQAEEINRSGVICEQLTGARVQYPVRATTKLRDDCLTIITVKYHQLPNIYDRLQHCSEQMPLLFMQNGLAHYEEALRLPQQHIAFSSVQFGAQKMDRHLVAERGVGVMKVAVARGEIEKFDKLQLLKNESIHVQYEQQAERMLFEKAVLNCFINPLTAILQIKNGALLHNKEAFLLMQSLYNEIILTFPEVRQLVSFADVTQLCEKTANNTSSMLADRLHKRKTEVETIVGAVIARAHKQQKTMPILQTLYQLVKAFEESGEGM